MKFTVKDILQMEVALDIISRASPPKDVRETFPAIAHPIVPPDLVSPDISVIV